MDIVELFKRVSESMHVGRSFGPAYELGDITVIPVAFVAGGGGAGRGVGPAEHQSEGHEDPATQGEGEGAGFGTVSWPLGAYVISGGDVRWRPAIDATRIAVAAIGGIKVLLKLRASAGGTRRRRGAT